MKLHMCVCVYKSKQVINRNIFTSVHYSTKESPS